MRRYGLRVATIGAACLGLAGCFWPAPGAGPGRTSFNPFEKEITPATVATVDTTGNKVDQDQDGRENEVKPFPGVQDDWFAVPTPLTGAPFQQTYAAGSLPIHITGPAASNSKSAQNCEAPEAVRSLAVTFFKSFKQEFLRFVEATLLEQGDDPDHVERVLHAMGFHPSVCHHKTY